MNDFIEQLASRKSFEALSPAERAAVLAEMPREQYEQIRAILLAAPALDAGPPPSPALRARLQERMRAQAAPDRWWNRRAPIWQSAAITLLALACLWFWKANRVREQIRPVVQVQTDTVWKEKIVYRYLPAGRAKPLSRIRPVAAVPPQQPDCLPLPGLVPELPALPAGGTALSNDPGLLDFFVQTR